MKKKIIVAYTCHGSYGCEIIKKNSKTKKRKRNGFNSRLVKQFRTVSKMGENQQRCSIYSNITYLNIHKKSYINLKSMLEFNEQELKILVKFVIQS